jgi:hypothetical protein
MARTGAHQEMDRQNKTTGNSPTTPLEMGRHLFLSTGNGSTLFSAHWKWIDTFFLLTGNGSTHFSDYNWIIVS